MCHDSMRTLNFDLTLPPPRCVYRKDWEANSQSDEEGVIDLCQHLLFIVDMLLLLQSDHVRNLHLLQGIEAPALLVLN